MRPQDSLSSNSQRRPYQVRVVAASNAIPRCGRYYSGQVRAEKAGTTGLPFPPSLFAYALNTCIPPTTATTISLFIYCIAYTPSLLAATNIQAYHYHQHSSQLVSVSIRTNDGLIAHVQPSSEPYASFAILKTTPHITTSAIAHMAPAMEHAEDLATVDMPSTPQPHYASLTADIPHGASPSFSTMAADFSPTKVPSAQACETTKNGSTLRRSTSMTPPPSSQVPRRWGSPVVRAITPSLSMLSSPPSTTINGIRREVPVHGSYAVPSSQHVAEASAAELRQMLQAAIQENSRLEANVAKLRMSAAHYKLQHQLLGIETEEDKNRMEVEHDMTRREVEVLRMAEQAREARGQRVSPRHSASSRYIAELRAYCEAMDSEVRLLNRRLEKAKDIISDRDERLENILDDNRNYIRRIRENREHLNRLKSPGGIYASATPRQQDSRFPVTPQQYRGTPQRTPRSHHQGHEDSQDSFAALLLADRVLNQENNSAPSTPTTSARPGAQRRHFHQHNRNVQSLSSLPSTPGRSRPMTGDGHLLPSVQFVPQSEPRYRLMEEYQEERNRKNRDSTISVEDATEIAEYNREARENELAESQASQSASQMLRRDPRQSFEVLGSPTPLGVVDKSGLLQSKLFGNVTKPGHEKRKRAKDDGQQGGKRSRVEGIGLGIGGW